MTEGNASELLRLRSDVASVLAGGAHTGDRFSLLEREVRPGSARPAPHRHPGRVEGFYVLDGAIGVEIDRAPRSVAAGGFILVPDGALHTFSAVGPAVARVLILHAPALDQYFRDLHDLWLGEAPTPEHERALMERHGLQPG